MESVSETWDTNSIFTWLVALENFMENKKIRISAEADVTAPRPTEL
jgi:hypothetical protein